MALPQIQPTPTLTQRLDRKSTVDIKRNNSSRFIKPVIAIFTVLVIALVSTYSRLQSDLFSCVNYHVIDYV